MARWDPWSDLFNLHSEVSRLVNDTFGGGHYLSGSHQGTAVAAALPVDIRQTDSEYLVEASVPGFTPEEVEVTLDQGVLSIRGEHTTEHQGDGRYLRRERSRLAFFRQLSLPQEVRSDEVAATFSNGVLTVRIPRLETPAPRRIKIEAAPAGAALEPAGPAAEVVETGSQG